MSVKGTIGKTGSTHVHGAPIAELTEDNLKALAVADGEWVAVYLNGLDSRAIPAVAHQDGGLSKDEINLDLAIRTVLLGPKNAEVDAASIKESMLSAAEEERGHGSGVEVSIAGISETRRARWSKEPRKRPLWWLWVRRLINRTMPTSAVLCQVSKGPVHLAEQSVALLDSSAMQVLGLSPGDEVVLSSVSPLPPSDKPTQFCRIVKVVKVYEHSKERKIQGVPVIQLSEAMRDQLGLDRGYFEKSNQPALPVPSVLVAPSRGYALTDNLRETALVISLGAFGVAVSLSDSPPTLRWSIALAGGVLIPLALIFWRVRTRLR